MTSAPPISLIDRLWRRLRFKLYGRRAGLGQPVPAEALDQEYASGAWDHFFGPEEHARHETLVTLIRSLHPRPRLLDLGCGSGRLASMLDPTWPESYLGVDLSDEGLKRARALDLPPPLNRFERRDFETWTPAPGACDLITFNECLGYAADPLATARRFASTLPAGGHLVVSHFRYGNHAEFWRRLDRAFERPESRVATNEQGKTWDIQVLRPRR